MSVSDLQEQFGQIDIYLFDQLLRAHIAPGMRIFDAGCGYGRNLIYLLREGYDVYGVDADPRAIDSIRRLAPHLPPEHFCVEPIEANSFPDQLADVVLSSAVLHFAKDDAHFQAMLQGSFRVLKPGGLFFCRLASLIGMSLKMEANITRLGTRRYLLADGSERYLVDEPTLLAWTRKLGGELVDPLKTTVVQDRRCMTTWVVRKNP